MPVVGYVEIDRGIIPTLKGIPSNIRKKIREGMVKISRFLQKEARDNAPKDTGHLAYGGKKKARYGPGGIFGKVDITRGELSLQAKAVYAAIVEYGGETRDYEAQPYLRPAFNENIQEVGQMIINSMSEVWGK